MTSSIDKFIVAFGNCIHKKPVVQRREKEIRTEMRKNSSDGVIKRSGSLKHNLPSPLIELTPAEKERLQQKLLMMHLIDYNLL